MVLKEHHADLGEHAEVADWQAGDARERDPADRDRVYRGHRRGITEGGEGDVFDHGILDRLRQLIGHVGGDESRSNGVAGHLAAGELAGD